MPCTGGDIILVILDPESDILVKDSSHCVMFRHTTITRDRNYYASCQIFSTLAFCEFFQLSLDHQNSKSEDQGVKRESWAFGH
eukprot:jgi/Botrbrau1/3444/Bobra.139_1s0024.1